jgi:hypothetical protein
MKLYLGLTENSPSHLTRVFAEMDGRLVDLNLAYAVYLAQVQGEKTNTYQLAAFHFPENIAAFLQRGEPALQAPGGLTAPVQAQTTKLNVAYTSTTTNFSMEMMITHVRTPKLHNIKHPSKRGTLSASRFLMGVVRTSDSYNASRSQSNHQQN